MFNKCSVYTGKPCYEICVSALLAEQYGCSGLILYSDPVDYSLAGEGVYPDTWYLPGTGAQRGTLLKLEGDPLTMHYPSTGKMVNTKTKVNRFYN